MAPLNLNRHQREVSGWHHAPAASPTDPLNGTPGGPLNLSLRYNEEEIFLPLSGF